MTNIIKKTLHIDGMHCSSCAINIEFDLEDISGVKSVQTNYAKQICLVEFDEHIISLKQIIAQIKETGYTARLTES